MTDDEPKRLMDLVSSPGSLEILLILSSGPCTKTDVYRLMNSSRNISDTLEVLETDGLVSVDEDGDAVILSLTYRGAMLTDLLRWADRLLDRDRFTMFG